MPNSLLSPLWQMPPVAPGGMLGEMDPMELMRRAALMRGPLTMAQAGNDELDRIDAAWLRDLRDRPAPPPSPGPAAPQQPAQPEVADPAASRNLGGLYSMLAEDPDVAYRASLLPFVRTHEGGIRLGMPQAALDLARGAVDLLAGPETGVMTPQATMALASMPAMGQAPAGALGTFAGRRAATAPLDDLARAERMAAGGADERAIWRDTGWFKGADDQWRFEVDDSATRAKPGVWVDDVVADRNVPLKEAFDHPALYQAYPETKNTWYGLKEGSGASYNANPAPTIKVGKDSFYNPPAREEDFLRSPTLHEAQHAVQDIEGFSPGGNVGTGMWVSPTMRPRLLEEAQRIMDEWKPASFEQWNGGGDATPDALKEYAAYVKDFNSTAGKAQRWAAAQEGAPARLYQRLAGEAEARAVQKRMDYTPEQRRAVFPFDDYDVPREQLIVRGIQMGR